MKGRVVIVTGSTQGVGLAIAHAAARAGAEGLVLTGRDASKGAAAAAEVERSGTPALFVAADLEQSDAPDLIFDAALKRFNHVDGLVNSAALTDRGSLVEADMKFWDRLFAVNARAPLFLMQRLVNHLRERKAPGSIVNILSVHARGGAPGARGLRLLQVGVGRADQEHCARASFRSHPRQWNHSGLGRFARRAADAGGHARQGRGMAGRGCRKHAVRTLAEPGRRRAALPVSSLRRLGADVRRADRLHAERCFGALD